MQHIVLAFAKEETANKVRKMLLSCGYEVYTSCHSKAELMRFSHGLEDLLVITGFKLPDATCDEIAEDIEGQIIAIVKPEQSGYISNEDIFKLPLPTNVARMDEAVGMLVKRFREARPERTLEDNELIETAKLYLMEHYMMDEPAAHRFIQKRSMNTGASMVKTARTILKK